MHTDQLLKYITDPEKMDMLSLEQLEAIIRTYPYFQAARVLYLKNLCILRSPRFREELERNIVYITDKRKLFLYLDSESYSWMNLLRNSD